MISRLFIVIVFGLGLTGISHALTFQDKQDKAITADGQYRTVESGTLMLHQGASDTSLDGAQLTVGTVPTDKNWHVTDVAYTYSGTVTNVRIALLANGVTVDQDGAPTSGEANKFSVDLWLDEGETVKLEPVGYTAGDTLSAWLHGYEYPDR
jgi:hypothetical protein